MSASVNLPLHHKVQKFSSGTSSPGQSRKKGRKTVVCVCVCECVVYEKINVSEMHAVTVLIYQKSGDANRLKFLLYACVYMRSLYCWNNL